MLPLLFQKISIWIIVIPTFVGIVNYKGLNRDAKWIFFLVLAALPPQILTGIINEHTSLLNSSYNLYTLVEFGILYLVFVSKFNSKSFRLAVSLSALLFMASFVFYLIWQGIGRSFLNEFVAVCYLLYLFWIFLLIKQEYEAVETLIEKHNPFTWFLLGILFYACGRLVTMALYYYIRDPDQPLRETLTLIDSIFNILLYLFFSFGLLIRRTH